VQWLKKPNQNNVRNISNVRREAKRYFRKKKEEYMKAKVDETETDSKNKIVRYLYKGVCDIKRVF
jgi:hypothetical protein